MKKSKVISLVAVVLTFGLMALGSGSGSTAETKEILSGGESASASGGSSVQSAPESGKASAVTIEEQVLIDQDGLKVTALEYITDSVWGDGIKILVENNSGSDLGLGCTALMVNDYMITDLFSATVAAGKKSNEKLYLSSAALQAAGIEEVGQVEICFHTFDPESYMPISEFQCVTIKTSAFETMDTTPNDAGQELYNENGIRIVGKYVNENSFWGAGILLYLENNSGKNAIIQCDDLSINGFMMTPLFSATVYDGKKAINDIALLSDELEENGITSVDEVELKFRIIDEDFMNSVESDVITFSAK